MNMLNSDLSCIKIYEFGIINYINIYHITHYEKLSINQYSIRIINLLGTQTTNHENSYPSNRMVISITIIQGPH